MAIPAGARERIIALHGKRPTLSFASVARLVRVSSTTVKRTLQKVAQKATVDPKKSDRKQRGR
jgi:hypothetical protein